MVCLISYHLHIDEMYDFGLFIMYIAKISWVLIRKLENIKTGEKSTQSYYL